MPSAKKGDPRSPRSAKGDPYSFPRLTPPCAPPLDPATPPQAASLLSPKLFSSL